MFPLKLSFMSVRDGENFNISTVVFVYSMIDDAVYCINYAISLSAKKQRSYDSFSN